jgi:putative pyruvate formate lyase activating enzyme
VEARDLARIFLDLQDRGAQNLDLVTGSPFIPGILAALGLARRGGLRIPLVWNTSGYESLRGVSLLAPVVDLWLPDLKTLNPALARRYLGAEDYPQAAKEALEAMTASPARGIPWQEEGEDRRLRMILRHLILPGQPESTREVLEFYAAFRREGIVLSLMTQYQPRLGSSPEGESTSPSRDGLPEELRRPLTGAEARRARRCLENLGIDEGFIQPPPGLGEDGVWQPDFHRRNPFPGDFSQTLWFWKDPPSE